MRKFLAVVVALVLVVLVGSRPVFAATNSPAWFLQSPLQGALKFNDAAKNPEKVDQWSFNFSLLTTSIAQFGFLAVGVPPTDKNQPLVGGAASFFAGGIDYMAANKPASSVDYIAYMGSKLRVPGTPEIAYAADDGGYGFSQGLKPILPLWTVMRNIAYALFAIIFVIIGLMIMFRVKIDPKTAASIQNSLPKIIFALILVTFSYAIAGFLIDLMWLLVHMVFTAIAAGLPIKALLEGGLGGIIKQDIIDKWTIFHFFLPTALINGGIASAAVAQIVMGFSGASWGEWIVSPLTAITKLTFGSTVGSILGILAFLIIAIALLWAMFMTWIKLLGAYANTILMIIFSPLLLMVEAIPGRSTFGFWLRGLLSNLLAFPFVYALLLIAFALAGSSLSSKVGVPLIGDQGFVPPLIGGNDPGLLQSLLAVGILLTMPKAVEILQEVLKAPAFKYGTAFMDPLKFGVNPFGITRGEGGKELGRRFYQTGQGMLVADQKNWDAGYEQMLQGKMTRAQFEAQFGATRPGSVPAGGGARRPGPNVAARGIGGVIDRIKGGSS